MCNGRTTWGGLPFGYHLDDDGLKRPCPPEQDLLCTIHYLSDNGMSYQAIANELNAKGLKTRLKTSYTGLRVFKLVKKHAPRYEYWEAFKASRK